MTSIIDNKDLINESAY